MRASAVSHCRSSRSVELVSADPTSVVTEFAFARPGFHGETLNAPTPPAARAQQTLPLVTRGGLFNDGFISVWIFNSSRAAPLCCQSPRARSANTRAPIHMQRTYVHVKVRLAISIRMAGIIFIISGAPYHLNNVIARLPRAPARPTDTHSRATITG